MTTSYHALATLAADILTPAEIDQYSGIFSEEPFNYMKLIELDRSMGGPGFSNVSCNGSGRYHVEDRDIFRPLQYCSMYFQMAYNGSDAHWLTRTLVQMSSLHIEGLIKRMVGGARHPLGRVLRDQRVRQKLDATTWRRIDQFTRVYNEAKHTVNHAKDTHLFSMEDAIMAYYISRKLAAALYPLVHLYTDLSIFSMNCP